MPEPPDAHGRDIPRSDQLNGWKEIAAFFGKAPRTVQRWESKLGLPVRRLSTPPGEIVFALRSELEAWRDTQSGRQLVDEAAWDDGVDDETPTSAAAGAENGNVPVAARSSRARRLIVAAVAMLAAAVAVAAWIVSRPGTVATAVFQGNTIVARDSSGRETWTYTFDRTLATPERGVWEDFAYGPGDPPLVTDLDRDGHPEVLAIATSGPGDSGLYDESLVCLSSSGTLRWSYRPEMTYRFRSRVGGPGPWQVMDVLIAEPPADPAVWVALAASPWWPSVVVRIDPGGRAEVRYVSAGAIYTLGQARTPEGWRLLAGGVLNGFRAASMAVLGDRTPAAASLETPDPSFECLDCPAGRPLGLVLFPRTDVNIQEGHKPYNQVCDIRRSSAGLEVLTIESELHSAFVHYSMGPSLDVTGFALSDSTAHHLLEMAGKVDHADARCPARTQGLTVRVWTPDGGWRDQLVRMAPR